MTKDVVEKIANKEIIFGPKPKTLKKPEGQTFSINEKSPLIRI
jgi:hypothetical protein